MKESRNDVVQEVYHAPHLKVVYIGTSHVICNSEGQMQSYEEDDEKFKF